jgi:hypothetical protein
MKNNTSLKKIILLIARGIGIVFVIGGVSFIWYIFTTPNPSSLLAKLKVREIAFYVSQFKLKPLSTSNLTINGRPSKPLSLTGCFSSTEEAKSCDGDSKKIPFTFLAPDSKLTLESLNSTNIKIKKISVENDTAVRLRSADKNIKLIFSKYPTPGTKIEFSFSGPIKLSLTKIDFEHESIQGYKKDPPQSETETLWFTPLVEKVYTLVFDGDDISLEMAANWSDSDLILEDIYMSISNWDSEDKNGTNSIIVDGEVSLLDENNKYPKFLLRDGQFLYIKPYLGLFSPILNMLTNPIGFNKFNTVRYSKNSSEFNIDLSGYAFQVSKGAKYDNDCNVPANCSRNPGKIADEINKKIALTSLLAFIGAVSAWFGFKKKDIRQVLVSLMKAAIGNASKSSSESPSDKSD